MGQGLREALVTITKNYDAEYNSFHLDKDFYFPGFWTVFTAFLNEKKIKERDFDCECSKQNSYLQTLGFHNILWNRPIPQRLSDGKTYTPLTLLSSAEATDDVTASINSCLRHFTGYTDGEIPDGLSQLNHVVGELLDNVWSHGHSTGFAMAQKTQVPKSHGSDYYLEFSVSDRGLGFLEETQRSGKAKTHQLTTHMDALNWCLQKGNSTKHADDIDPWAQQLPPEHVGESPFGAGIGTDYEENHHQGLGLAHLVELVERFQGEMIIASGNAMLMIHEDGNREELALDTPWKGVAISCKLKLSSLIREIADEPDEELLALMEQLKGGI